MGQKTKLPTVVDEMPNISAGMFKRAGFYKKGNFNLGEFTLLLNDGNDLKVKVVAAMKDRPALVFQYHYEGHKMTEIIRLSPRESNMCPGAIIYSFICPISGAIARKLIFIQGRFVHRSVLKGSLYRCQIRSQKWRKMDQTYGDYIESDYIHEELNKKYFRKFYNGKLTKRYKKLLSKLENANGTNTEKLRSELETWANH
ncbi:hypothetical protein B0O79_1017 [Flavobacteriaceae bacterium MAR_2009_75]|nr:hypothetical protein B0O79_1017 [Flavobacteriaceae bacterium MAR_2009_75]